MDKLSVIKNRSTLIEKSSPEALLIRIVGATMDDHSLTLLKIIKNKSEEDAVVFCAVSGLLYLITESERDLKEILNLESYNSSYEELVVVLDIFSVILEKNQYQDYPIAVMPSLNIDKQVFWGQIFKKLLPITIHDVFIKAYRKDDTYGKTNLVHKVIFILSQYDLVAQKRFFQNDLKEICCTVIDEMYIANFSNSVNKIWDAQRAAREYFIRKFILFNRIIPIGVKKAVEKRWQAWFLLEDFYKMEHKSFKRDELLSKMYEGLKLLKTP
jgi:hypothetical protein